jgi:monoamine oxidase
MIEVWCGGSIKNISTNFLYGYKSESEYKNSLFGDYGGSHCLFNNGAKTLLDSIIKSADNITNIFDKIKFNQIVIKIINHDYYVQVYTSDGNIYNCNKLCIGIPPGPLKNIIFEPPLSPTKLNSLSKIQMGSYKKIQLEFEPNQVFWNKQIPMFLTSNPKITGKEYYLYQYDNSNKANKKNKELFPYILWNNYLYSKNKPILEAICPGDIGWEISGKPDEEIIDLVLSQLNNYFPNVPEPKA